MREIRIFVDAPLAAEATVPLPPRAAEHAIKVLRLRAGSPLTLFDGRGGEYAGRIAALEGRGAVVELGAHVAREREAPRPLTLWMALLRGEKMDWVVQKATELGVQRIVPIASARSVVQLERERADRRVQHWRDVAIAACEQCGRNRIPLIESPRELPRALAEEPRPQLSERRLMLMPQATVGLGERLASSAAVQLLVGPEGGFEPEESALAARVGFEACSLGERTLRAETAMLAALALAAYTSPPAA